MKINQKAWCISVLVVLFSCNPTPLSYSAEKIDSSSRQKLISVVNLTNESSANAVIRNNGVIEFKGNELVASVTATMASSGTLPPDSNLALPKIGTNMAIDFKTAPTPLALVEKDLQAGRSLEKIDFNALGGDATKIAREPVGNSLRIENQVSVNKVGTGARDAK